MTVSELARRAGVTADTVRHYTRSGLLVPIRYESNGYNCRGFKYGKGQTKPTKIGKQEWKSVV